MACVIGLDFGTDTVRAVVADAATGAVLGASVRPYPRWAQGLHCEPRENRFRHHPLDYLETLEGSVTEALAAAGPGVAARVRGIAADTTGSTPVFTDARARPLGLSPALAGNPNAMFILWKDHTALAEAARINQAARTWGGPDYTRYEGGIYSTEWFWAKALHVLEADPAVASAAVSLLELCDWIPAVLTGTEDLGRIRRSRCAAGHKAMWHAEFGGYPSDQFLAALHPRLVGLKATLGRETFTSDTVFGPLCAEWAARLGVPREVVVAVGAFDAHMGAVGGGVAPGRLVKIIGTSGLDMLVAPKPTGPERLVAGICGQVDGSILPGMIGYEAGQSAFGDIFAWFARLLAWPLEAVLPSLDESTASARAALAAAVTERILPGLERAAARLGPEESAVVALDWLNGRRTPDANQRLTGALAGLSLGTDAPQVYRALVEAAAFGSRAIVERFRSQGLAIEGVIAIGGVARKSPFVMQTLADVMDMEIAVAASDQAVALGAAMFAATAAGLYGRVEDAQRAMVPPTETVYRPNPARAHRYQARYGAYRALGTHVERELDEIEARS
jgi:L-ribulokinase